MKQLRLALVLLFAVAVSAGIIMQAEPSEEDVIVLNADNLESTIYESEDTWFLDLYAPWCISCKALKPEWAKLATKLKGVAKVAKIDASITRKFHQAYGLKGYPNVVFIPAGPKDKKIYQTYKGDRTTNNLYDWALIKMKLNKGFQVERLTNEQKWIDNCVSLNIPYCIISFLPNTLDSSEEEQKEYLKIIRGTVNNFRNKPISFLWTQAGDHPELQEQFSLYFRFPAVLMINPQLKVFQVMNNWLTEENFKDWLKDVLNRNSGYQFSHYTKPLSF